MRTILKSDSVDASTPSAERGVLERLLSPLDQLAARSPNLTADHAAVFEVDGRHYNLSRYRFIGPTGGDTPLHVGIFGAIHGNEPEGAYAIAQLIKLLEAKPELATGYYLSLYPVCNPTGFEDGTRHSRKGVDLNRQFWSQSNEPEIRLLQTDLLANSFHGIISLHASDAVDGFHGVVRGPTLAKHLIEPALRAAGEFLPRDSRPLVDGFQIQDGVDQDIIEGVLSAPPKTRPRPFEIALETPKAPPSYLKECAFVVALQTILAEYRKLISYAQNI